MIDWIVNVFSSPKTDTSCLCSEECSSLGVKDNKHYCTKYKKILQSPKGRKDLCHPLENCGGMIEAIMNTN